MVAVTRALAPVLATIALCGVVVAWAPGASAAEGPEIMIASEQAREGEKVTVTGRGWARGKEVTVSVCEDPGGSRSLTCAPDSRQGVLVSGDGYFTTELEVVTPEGGCPCVVAVDSPSDQPVTKELTISGSDNRASDRPAGLVVEETRLVGGQGLATWFGGAPEPDLELTLHNGGTAPAELSIRLHWRDGLEEPVTVPVSAVSALGPGETRTVVVPLRFDSWSQGGHTVEGTVSTSETVVPFTTQTTVAPWGLYALVVVALATAAGWRNRWLFAPRGDAAIRSEELDDLDDEELEARALSLIDRAVSSAGPRVPRQAAAERVPEQEPEHEPAWEPMDPAEMIERSTLSVPRQRSQPGRRADRSDRSTRLKDAVGSLRRR